MTEGYPQHSPMRRCRKLVLTHGRAATSWQILHQDLSLWFPAAGDGVIGFARYGRTRIAAGEPVCAEEHLVALSREFEQDAARCGEGVCYLAAEGSLVERLERDGRHQVLPIGAQPVWEPAVLAACFDDKATLRYQVNRARNKGLRVEEWPAERFDHPDLPRCLARWLASKPLPPLGFMTDPYLLSRMDGRRLLVAEVDGAPVGYTVLSPVPARQGWLVEQIVRCDGAPNGDGRKPGGSRGPQRGSSRQPLHHFGHIAPVPPGPTSFPPPSLLAEGRHGLDAGPRSRFYNFRGLEHFKAKFEPQAWEPVYAVVADPRLRPAALYAVMGAFTGRSPILAGLQAVGAGAAVELQRLARRLGWKG